MILIALSWIYIFLTVVPIGVFTARFFGIRNDNLPEISLLGLFTITLSASLWAFFGRINFEFHLFLLTACTILFLKYKTDIAVIYNGLFARLKRFSLPLKILFGANAIIILAQSAAAPYVLDNESYYIQTVKWLNEYGFVNGLANLHVFFAQQSGWHIAQSVYSLSFAYARFNDLSGWCLLVGNLYAFFRLADYRKNTDRNLLIAGLLPLANAFFLRFSGAPSPDIAVYMLTFIAVDRFLSKFANPDRSAFGLLALLSLFAIYCKTSAVVIMLLPLFLMVRGGFRIARTRIVVLSLVVLGLFIGKNYIVSGQPFHPLPYTAGLKTGHTLPKVMADLYFNETKAKGYELPVAECKTATSLALIKRWASLPKLHGFFNRLTLMLLACSPLLIWRFRNRKALWLLYLCLVLQILLSLYSSPQYRLYLNFVLIFGMFILTVIAFSRKMIVAILSASVVISLILLIRPLRLEAFTDNSNADITSGFAIADILIPEPNSRMGDAFLKQRIGNMEYHSLKKSAFFWATGEAELPAVNRDQLDFFAKYYGIRPQMRSQNLKDGFYTEIVPTNNDER